MTALGLGLASTSVAAPASAAEAGAERSAPAVRWHSCPPLPKGSAPWARGTKCGTVRVPLDYRHPKGRTIDVMVSRTPATSKARRRGVLLFNPGGPGGEGLSLPSQLIAGKLLPATVLQQYDLIGFDPRGVSRSAPVTCGINPVQLATADARDEAATTRLARSIAQQCAARSGAVLPYLTTANTARDMDRIRQALGVPKISYYGISYGTYLGAVYASFYPQRVDRMVLDSAVDPAKIWYEQFRQMGEGLQQRLPDVFSYAARQHGTLQLGSTPDAVQKSYDDLVWALDAKPLALPGSRIALSGDLLRSLTFNTLYLPQGPQVAATVWKFAKALRDGTATGLEAPLLVDVIDALLLPHPAPGVPADNQEALQLAVLCGDVAWPRDPAVYERNVASDRKRYPLSDGETAGISPCAFWPYRPIEHPVKVTNRGPRDILILQNRRDPATPASTAHGLRTALGRRAVEVLVDAGGHGVIADQNACATRALTGFLGAGKLPASDRNCPAAG